MRGTALLFVVISIVTSYGCGHINARSKAASPATGTTSSVAPNPSAVSAANFAAVPVKAETRVDFATQIKPIFEARCQPCHFSGGKVYAQMPFDRPETIKTMGSKLFTRIKDENERRLIRDFLAQE